VWPSGTLADGRPRLARKTPRKVLYWFYGVGCGLALPVAFTVLGVIVVINGRGSI
jgi:hypothetical protein